MPLRRNHTDSLHRRIIQFDALRGIAILMVVGFHFTTRYQQIYGHPSQLPFEMSDGHFGVKLFFLISGFAIFMSLERTSNSLDFLVFRWARLFPAYWCSVLLTHVAVTLFSLPGRETSTYAAIVNLSMLQQWLCVPHVDEAYWVLTVELSFYSLMVAVFMLQLLPRIERIAAVWLGLMITVMAVENFSPLRLPLIVKTSLLLEHGNLFVAGIMFYRMQHRSVEMKPYLILASALAVEFLLHGLRSGFVCGVFFMVFYSIVRKVLFVNLLLSAKPLVSLGAISYCLYLLHQNIGYVLLQELYEKKCPPLTAILITITVTTVIAACLTRLVENPAREMFRSYWMRFRIIQVPPIALAENIPAQLQPLNRKLSPDIEHPSGDPIRPTFR
jgi:peptidoglycan/LPS O-acetylase OafA/YrhL